MTLDAIRRICRSLPGITEDIKWGCDLAFSVGGKMFCVVNTESPHQMSFKCTADDFAELVEREGLIPAPYLARAMWVQQTGAGRRCARAQGARAAVANVLRTGCGEAAEVKTSGDDEGRRQSWPFIG